MGLQRAKEHSHQNWVNYRRSRQVRGRGEIAEELVVAESRLRTAEWEKILINEPDRVDFDRLHRALRALHAEIDTCSQEELRGYLQRLVPIYRPREAVY